MKLDLSFGRCPSCKSHIFGAKMKIVPAKSNKPKWYKGEVKIKLCPVCNVEIVDHPASSYVWMVILVLITLYNLYIEGYIEEMFGEFSVLVSFLILILLAFLGLLGMWCFGYKTLAKESMDE